MKSCFATVFGLSSVCLPIFIICNAVAGAQGGREIISDLENFHNELKENEHKLQAYDAENIALHRKNELTTKSLAVLMQSLAEANAEAELFRRQYTNLKLRMEVLGVGVVMTQPQGLEQRLLKGVRDLELIQRQQTLLSERLLALAECVFRYLKSAPEAGDPIIRLDVESELRATDEVLRSSFKHPIADSLTATATLQNGLVVSVKDEWALIVTNVGSKHGVRLGMPLTIVRGDKLVGRARVVDVRDAIAGAVVEEGSLGLGKIKVGDQVRVEVQEIRVSEK